MAAQAARRDERDRPPLRLQQRRGAVRGQARQHAERHAALVAARLGAPALLHERGARDTFAAAAGRARRIPRFRGAFAAHGEDRNVEGRTEKDARALPRAGLRRGDRGERGQHPLPRRRDNGPRGVPRRGDQPDRADLPLYRRGRRKVRPDDRGVRAGDFKTASVARGVFRAPAKWTARP